MGRYRSGQPGQTVNLLALPSQVRILPGPPSFTCEGCLTEAPQGAKVGTLIQLYSSIYELRIGEPS